MIFADENKKYEILPWHAKTLIGTSLITIIPIYVAFCRELWFHCATSSGTMVFSILYWAYPIHSWRRNIDLLYAKFSFVVYLGSGVIFIPYGFPFFIFICGSYSIANMYRLTYIYPKQWIYYHAIFHLLSIMTKLYIILYIPLNYKSLK